MLLTAKYVIPITSPYIEDGAVLVRDDKILDLGSASQLKDKYPMEEVRDFGLSALMPGLRRLAHAPWLHGAARHVRRSALCRLEASRAAYRALLHRGGLD